MGDGGEHAYTYVYLGCFGYRFARKLMKGFRDTSPVQTFTYAEGS